MTADLYAAVNGHRVTHCTLTVSNVGPWHAEVDFEAEPDLAGRVTLAIGDLKLSGTIDASASGTFGLQRRARILAGAGGWGSEIGAKSYHNDGGVKARNVAEDAARAVGETIGTFVPRAERIGRDYARQTGPASVALEDVIGGVPWWLDYEGVTHVGIRASVPIESSAYEVLAYDPRDRIATLAVDDPGAVRIGSVISERLDEPQTVRSLELRVTPEELRVIAWCGGSETSRERLTGLLRAIARRANEDRLFGAYRYRVVRMNAERVELQAVRKLPGLPDLLPLSMWPGIAGAHAELAPGAEVLVSFLEGDRAQPIVTHFAGADGQGFEPVRLHLGGTSGAPAARQGDAVEVLLPPAMFAGTIGGSPASGVLTFTASKMLGTITAGSGKVRIA